MNRSHPFILTIDIYFEAICAWFSFSYTFQIELASVRSPAVIPMDQFVSIMEVVVISFGIICYCSGFIQIFWLMDFDNLGIFYVSERCKLLFIHIIHEFHCIHSDKFPFRRIVLSYFISSILKTLCLFNHRIDDETDQVVARFSHPYATNSDIRRFEINILIVKLDNLESMCWIVRSLVKYDIVSFVVRNTEFLKLVSLVDNEIPTNSTMVGFKLTRTSKLVILSGAIIDIIVLIQFSVKLQKFFNL